EGEGMSMDAEKLARIDRMLNPKTMVVIGDKRQGDYMWLRAQQNFTGQCYSVQIDEREIPGILELGYQNFKSIHDVPGEIDFAIVAVPRQVAPIVLKDLIERRVGGAAFFTSGFRETGEQLGIELQDRLTQMAREADFLMIGPNCMGLYNRRLGVRFQVDLPTGDAGTFGFVSQSGTHAINFGQVGSVQGIKVSKCISTGNSVVLEATDWLDYLGQDAETQFIGMYVEGLRDGRRFFDLLKEITPRKPVVILKGGQTAQGQRATASHTASLAEPMSIWDAIYKQTGAIRADSFDELIDAAKAVSMITPTTANRVGLFSQTGGQSVVVTDAFAKVGMEVPLLSDVSYERLGAFFNIVGGSFRNPIDMGQNWTGEESFANILQILDEDPVIDIIVLEILVSFMWRRWERRPELQDALFGSIRAFRERSRKPILVVLPTTHRERETIDVKNKLLEYDITSFPSFDRAARALKKAIDYHRFRAEAGRGVNS
ncbi:MAG TPA: CoA-binding protein, partial [Dehalococcoidia bacterium]|nr:CoA-binding protein [Dehalococcoidia bacterium]